MLLAGFAAHRGLLHLPTVMLLAFVASTLGDQMFFWIGRRFGSRLFARFPRLAAQAPRVQGLLDKYHAPLILGIRFMYGLRIAGPVAMGALHVPALRFAALNLIGAALWSVLVAWLGYQFGNLLELVLPDIKRAEEFVALAMLVAGLAVAWIRIQRARKVRR